MKQRHAALIGAAGILILDAAVGVTAVAHERAPDQQSTSVPESTTDRILNQSQDGLQGVAAPAAAKWRATDPMVHARSGHTATLLGNGTVLVAGGGPAPDGRPRRSAELYDPEQGSWTTTDVLHQRRFGHTATQLESGRVLVAGGDNGGLVLRQAELYDAKTGTWTVTDPMTIRRKVHTATLLSDGTVLVVGGLTEETDDVLASAEIYHPSTGIWTSTGSLSTGRIFHTATLLDSGKVLVTGGYSDGPDPGLATAELYDPATGDWTNVAPMNHRREAPTATLLESGLVLVAGGWNGDGILATELYDPSTGSWTETGDLRDTREGAHRAVRLRSGGVLVTGGFYGPTGRQRATAEIYHPASGTWKPAGTMAVRRVFHSATVLYDGSVLVAGGSKPRRSAELYFSQ